MIGQGVLIGTLSGDFREDTSQHPAEQAAAGGSGVVLNVRDFASGGIDGGCALSRLSGDGDTGGVYRFIGIGVVG